MKKTITPLALALAFTMSPAHGSQTGEHTDAALMEIRGLLGRVVPLWVRAEELGRQCQFEFRRYGWEARDTCREFEVAFRDAGVTGERIGQLSNSLNEEEIADLDISAAVFAGGVAERTRAIYQHVMAEMRGSLP